MTSAEDFPDEPLVPPVVLNTTDLPLGSIIAVTKSEVQELRLGITVSDDNIDDTLEVRARLSVLGEPYEYVCAEPIGPALEPQRPQTNVVLQPSTLRDRVCTKVEIFVSSSFAGDCPPLDVDNRNLFGVPSNKRDVARAQFWIWEMSGGPLSNPNAAQALVQSCDTMLRAQISPPQMVQ